MTIFTPAIPAFLLPLAPPRLALPLSLSQELSIPGFLLNLGAELRWVCTQHDPWKWEPGVEGESRVLEKLGLVKIRAGCTDFAREVGAVLELS